MKIDGTPMFTHRTLEHWKQFTVCPRGCLNKFPALQVLCTFLPEFLRENRAISTWHVLFEPSALIRFTAANPKTVLKSAAVIAERHSLEFHLGDVAPPQSRNRDSGEDYHGEADIYGGELWEANKQFMNACSVLSVALAKLEPNELVWPTRKFMHLLCNILGLNYLEEAALHQDCAARALELYKEYGKG
jgi:hypothetical protein